MRVRIVLRHAVQAGILALAAGMLAGCQLLLLGGAAVGGTLVATDRRTSGALVEDQAIELKAISRIKEATLSRGHFNVTSYNRIVLLTGEAYSAADRIAAQEAVARIEGVRSVINESAEMPSSSVAARSADTLLSAKVKTTLFDSKGTLSNAYKVVVERNVVYLMGRVTDTEAADIADIASSVPGVEKVVRVFEILTDEELKALRR